MRNQKKGFSLVELVIVVVIIGVLAAIAIPRLSRGASGAGDSALQGNLKVLRTAIDLYASEHGGKFPSAAADLTDALTKKTDIDGTVGTTAGTHIYGPYLRAIPPLPVGVAAIKGKNTVGTTPGTDAWIYDKDNGTIKAGTTTEKDEKGVDYNAY